MADDLPPEAPPCDDTPATTSAPSATSSPKSTGGDQQSTFRRPTSPSPQSKSSPGGAPSLPGVEDYLTGTQKAAEAAGQFTRPRATMRTQGKSKPVIPMEGKALEVAGRLKELFHAYDNRQSEDNRSAQTTMGPSEIGSPCDRRIAMSLLRLPAVNPGGDGWAAFVGTCVHVGLADMFVWGNANSGRYQTEVPLTFNSAVVPRGTTDLLDTTLLMAVDHKVQGDWSRKKLMTEGPSETYRVQAHTYALGARLAGFEIKDVAIVSWPRERSSLDDLYVWTEPYDPAVARGAIARVERIADELAPLSNGRPSGREYQDFPINNTDCKYCPFHLPGAAKSEEGKCNGRD